MKLKLIASAAALAAGLSLFVSVGPVAAEAHEEAAAPALVDILAHGRRDGDRPRDQYRRPVETLDFFQVEPTMTVAEYGPGGGWYTRVLAPYLSPAGQYIAFNADSDRSNFNNRAAEARAKGWTERFAGVVAEMVGSDADSISAYEVDEMPEELEGTVDRVLIFRSMHGLANSNTADDVIDAARWMLKDDGMIGVVQHRAPTDASFDDYSPAPGYMKVEQVIAIFAANGFELIESSEINANPNDPADWEGGVWTLPPVLRYGEENREEYLAIGESDRMTLLFKKVN